VLIVVENWLVPPDRRTWDESRALAAAGYGVSVICPQAPGQARYERRDGVCFHPYPPPRESHSQLSYVHEIGRHDCHFAFLGDGAALPDVRRLAHELQLDDWMTFTGWADDDMVLGYLSIADVGLHPDPKEEREDISTTEKSLEYMALGLPFVAFNLKEVRSTAGESALYAEGNDVETYALLLGELLDNPERRAAMAQEGRRRIEESLSWDRQQMAYMRLYDDLLGGRSQAQAAALPTGTRLAYG
jgi:glycosyltransferase involved in cell wall biosynthesis